MPAFTLTSLTLNIKGKSPSSPKSENRLIYTRSGVLCAAPIRCHTVTNWEGARRWGRNYYVLSDVSTSAVVYLRFHSTIIAFIGAFWSFRNTIENILVIRMLYLLEMFKQQKRRKCTKIQ